MLPYRLWVDYNDGKGEYRQVRWDSPTTKLKGHGTGHYLYQYRTYIHLSKNKKQ